MPLRRDAHDLRGMDNRKAKAFFRRNTSEIIERMYEPSDPTNNLAARIVARYAIDPRLRSDARRAIEAARMARQAKSALENALDGYAVPNS